jgi:catechol 2,3-dioxygenase-like lactoylglutathione lyase family enzyme
MRQNIGYVAMLVRDYDEAIDYFIRVLRFALVEDTPLTDDKRWVLVAPPGSNGTCLVLAKAVASDQVARIGSQASDRVFLFLHTDNFWRDYHDMKACGVMFREAPRREPYGTVAVFEDLYGNRWDLLQLEN